MVYPELNQAELQEILLAIEESDYQKIQNEKDDEQIYSFGLLSLTNSSIMTQGLRPISEFPFVFKLVSNFNFFYNLESRLLIFRANQTEEEKHAYHLGVYEVTKATLFSVIYDYESIAKEWEEIAQDVGKVSISTDELVELFGFKSLFVRLLALNSKAKNDVLSKLKLKTFEFNSKLKDFVEGLQILRQINAPLMGYFLKIADLIQSNQGIKKGSERIQEGSVVMNLLLELKQKGDRTVESIHDDVVYLKSFRVKLLELIGRLDPSWLLLEEMPSFTESQQSDQDATTNETVTRKAKSNSFSVTASLPRSNNWLF